MRDLDYVGKSDPFCKVFVKNDERTDWILAGQTEVIKDNLDPEFVTPVTINYFFEKTQQIRFEVWDDDSNKPDQQGTHSTQVGELVGAKNQTYIAKLEKGKSKDKQGTIIIKSDNVRESHATVKIQLKAKGLKPKKRMKMFKSNHPFLIIKRCLNYEKEDHESAVKVFTSKVLDDTLDPAWSLEEIKLQDL